jgi:hypothetical protein
MFLLECNLCHTKAFVDETQVSDFDAALVCPPSDDCCGEDHHHGEAVERCPGGHGACPTPDNCAVWLGMQPHLPDSNVRDTSAGPCPGGHHGFGVDGCTVCRPITITPVPGSMSLRRAD